MVKESNSIEEDNLEQSTEIEKKAEQLDNNEDTHYEVPEIHLKDHEGSDISLKD
jgi:hypothetical protein